MNPRVRIVCGVCALLLLLRLGVELLREHIVINVTESMPLGLYRREPFTQPVHKGQLVYVRVPAHVQTLLYTRRYIPKGAQLVKRVLALPGDHWCATPDQGFWINEQLRGPVAVRDQRGELLPLWSQQCHELAPGFVLVGSDAPRSFDSRYFGPVPVTNLLSEVTPLWLWTSTP